MLPFPRAASTAIGSLILVAACSTGASDEPGSTDLTITVTLDAGIPPDIWTLTCDPDGGSHPNPGAACGFLADARLAGTDPFAPVPDDVACTQEYRGPATATVTGTWNGEDVDAAYNLTNGCEIARWTEAEPLLGPLPAAN